MIFYTKINNFKFKQNVKFIDIIIFYYYPKICFNMFRKAKSIFSIVSISDEICALCFQKIYYVYISIRIIEV